MAVYPLGSIAEQVQRGDFLLSRMRVHGRGSHGLHLDRRSLRLRRGLGPGKNVISLLSKNEKTFLVSLSFSLFLRRKRTVVVCRRPAQWAQELRSMEQCPWPGSRRAEVAEHVK